MNRSESVTIHAAEANDLPAVMNVIDGALLAAEASIISERIETGDVLIASAEGRIRGVLVRSGRAIEVIAVRRRYRTRGIGTALVDRARAETTGALVAAFDSGVRPFYESLGFDVWPIGENRCRGRDTGKG